MEAVGEDELKSLENLKATHELITSSYQNDLLMLQEQHNILTVHNEEQKSHLVEALLAKDKLRHELANLRQGNSADSAEIRTDIGDSQEAARKTKSELEALKEVSNEPPRKEQPPSPRWRHKFWAKMASGISFHPKKSKLDVLDSSGKVNASARHDAEIATQGATLESPSNTVLPFISPELLPQAPQPMAVIPLRYGRGSHSRPSAPP